MLEIMRTEGKKTVGTLKVRVETKEKGKQLKNSGCETKSYIFEPLTAAEADDVLRVTASNSC